MSGVMTGDTPAMVEARLRWQLAEAGKSRAQRVAMRRAVARILVTYGRANKAVGRKHSDPWPCYDDGEVASRWNDETLRQETTRKWLRRNRRWTNIRVRGEN